MKIFNQTQLDEAAKILQAGKILIFPTETSYGLGCDASNQKAVDKIYKIKGREENKSLLAIVPNVEMAKRYLEWNDLLEKLAGKYWPGPLTIVSNYVGELFGGSKSLSTEYRLAQGVVSRENTVAVRVTANPVANELSLRLGRPLVATSANIAGAGEIYDDKKIIKIFEKAKSAPDAFLNFGKLKKQVPTTIVSVSCGEIKVLRQGELEVKIN